MMTPSRAALLGASAGAAMLAVVGSWADLAAAGGLGGGVLGGIVGLGVALRRIGPIVLAAILGAIFSCMIGPACDDYGGHAAPGFAAVAASIAWLVRSIRRASIAQAEADRLWDLRRAARDG